MLTNTVKILDEERSKVLEELKVNATLNEQERLFLLGKLAGLYILKNNIQIFINDEINQATENGYGQDYLEGLISGINVFLDLFSFRKETRELKQMKYKVKVVLNETAEIVNAFTDVIVIEAPAGMNMGQLKDWLMHQSPKVIEEYIFILPTQKPVEVFDFDLELVGYEPV